MKWIKMSEKLPEYGGKVFVRMQDSMWVGLLFKDSDDGFKGNILTLRGALEDVTGERIDHFEWLDESLPADDMTAAFQNEPVNFLLSNALRYLTQDQQRELRNALQERLPVPASIEQEAERLYPDTKENETVSMGHNGIQDLRRSAHITAARQYMDTIEKLRAENEKYRKALEAEGYCTMCHEKKKKHALLVCDTCYDSFDGDRRSFWDDNFIH